MAYEIDLGNHIIKSRFDKSRNIHSSIIPHRLTNEKIATSNKRLSSLIKKFRKLVETSVTYAYVSGKVQLDNDKVFEIKGYIPVKVDEYSNLLVWENWNDAKLVGVHHVSIIKHQTKFFIGV